MDETNKRKLDENSNFEESNGSQPKVSSQELPSTYQAEDSNDEEQVISVCRPVLFPMTPALQKIELGDDNPRVTIGRLSFGRDAQPFPEQDLRHISQKHCIVERNPYILGTYELLDSSLNGVFLNGNKVARGSRSMLENCVEISLGLPKNKAYCFINKDIVNDEVFTEKFVMGQKLGSGGLGTVHRCFRATDGFPLAVKVIVKQRLSQSMLGESSERQNTLIQREISILRRISDLEHPHIIKLHEVFDRPDRVMLVMELCQKDMLSHLTKRMETFSEIDARVCMKQVLLALNFLHSNNIVHRDLKLENILVATVEPLTIKLADFGLSRTADLSQPKTICGTENYLAPEIIQAARMNERYSEKVDCWSAGVVLFLLLYKQYPFSAKQSEKKSVFDSILRDRPHIPTKYRTFVSSDASHLVSGLLKKKVQDRLCASGALQHVWFEENRSESPSSSSGSSCSTSSSESTGNDDDDDDYEGAAN